MILDERPMNIQLLSTFQENYPKEFDGILDCASMAVCCAFNKVGECPAENILEHRWIDS